MSELNGRIFPNLRNRQGVVLASITHLTTHLKDLEINVGQQIALTCLTNCNFLIQNLKLNALLDLTEDEETLQKEQAALDEQT